MRSTRATGFYFISFLAYLLATLGVLGELGGTLILADGGERTAVFARWGSLYTALIGFAWQTSALLVTAVAYRLRSTRLALVAAGSFLLTGAFAYLWAIDTAYEGAGAWDVLRWITIGGVYPMVAVSLVVGAGAILTVARTSKVPRRWLV